MNFDRAAVGWLMLSLASLGLFATRVAGQSDSTPPACDWPFIRGSNFDGHSAETALADRWPETGPPVLWTASWAKAIPASWHGMTVWRPRPRHWPDST